MKKILKISAIASAILTPTFAQAQATSPMEVSATVISGCFISAENINFGNLITPITTQTAQSNMTVKCSNNTNLSIAINYGLVSASGGEYSFVTVKAQVSWAEDQHLVKLYKNGVAVTGDYYDISCHPNPNGYGGSGFRTSTEIINKFNIPVTIHNGGYWETGTDMCDSNGKFNLLNSFLVTNIGALSGLSHGEKIKYSLEKPNSTIVWNNSNTHIMKSTGVEQLVPLKAIIKNTDNPTYRMTPDTYQDTLTVVLTY